MPFVYTHNVTKSTSDYQFMIIQKQNEMASIGIIKSHLFMKISNYIINFVCRSSIAQYL